MLIENIYSYIYFLGLEKFPQVRCKLLANIILFTLRNGIISFEESIFQVLLSSIDIHLIILSPLRLAIWQTPQGAHILSNILVQKQ